MARFYFTLIMCVCLFFISCTKTDSEFLEVSTTQIISLSDGSSQEVEVKSSHPYFAESSADWCSIDFDKGKKGRSTFTITTASNPDKSDRSAEIRFKIDGGETMRVLHILQTRSIVGSIEGGETIHDIKERNIFSNGSQFNVGSMEGISLIGNKITPTNDPELQSDAHTFYISFSTIPKTLLCSIILKRPESDGWVLCELKDGVWQEVNSSQVKYHSDQTVSFGFPIHFVQTYSSPPYRVITLAFIRVSNFFSTDFQVLQNPYGLNPFCASISFQSRLVSAPRTLLLGQDNNDLIHTHTSGSNHSLEILGLYNRWDNTVHIDVPSPQGTILRRTVSIHIDFADLQTLEFKTRFAHGFKNDPGEIYIATGGAAGGNSFESQAALGYDQYGKIRWANTDYVRLLNFSPISYQAKDVICGYGNLGPANGGAIVAVYDMSGKNLINYRSFLAAGVMGLHHDVVKINDQVWSAPYIKGSPSGDWNNQCMIVEFDTNTGAVLNTMDLEDIIDPTRPNTVSNDNGLSVLDDRIHINSICYSPSDDCIIVSARHQGVFKIRRGATDASGLVWWLTPPTGVATDYQLYLLTPTNFDNSDHYNAWNNGQHTATILPNGDIMMFDNHNPIEWDPFTRAASRVWVVRIDEAKKTVTQVNEWHSPGRDDSWYQSSAYMLPNGNVISGWAIQKCVYETSYPDGRILFEGRFIPGNVRGYIYRFYKMSLY